MGPSLKRLLDHAVSQQDKLRADLSRVAAERDEAGKALVSLTCDGSEFYLRDGDGFRVDPVACLTYIKRARDNRWEALKRFIRSSKAAEARASSAERQLAVAVAERDAALATAGPLYQALYAVLERHGAEPDVLSIVGSLGDTLSLTECAEMLQDWLATGQSVRGAQ